MGLQARFTDALALRGVSIHPIAPSVQAVPQSFRSSTSTFLCHALASSVFLMLNFMPAIWFLLITPRKSMFRTC
jgi:hypothetical protein